MAQAGRRGNDNTIFNLKVGKDYVDLHAHLPKRRTIISLGLIVATVIPVLVELVGRVLQSGIK
jgi:hypothetical protein